MTDDFLRIEYYERNIERLRKRIAELEAIEREFISLKSEHLIKTEKAEGRLKIANKNLADAVAMLGGSDSFLERQNSGNTCKWNAPTEEDSDCWETSCGEAFVFETETPGKNGYRFCPSCGKKLVEIIREVED